MIDLKFDKRDLDMVFECLVDLKYASCKEAVADPYFEGVIGVATDIHGIVLRYKQQSEHYIELYMDANPNQKDYFRCPKCKRILNAHTDWRLKAEHIMGIPMFDSRDKATEFYCEDCGWTGEEAPFEEVKEGGNQEE
jgi:predicted RNA-binding Zn-ribbon protein involved in translation (DUF1610 family)